MDLFDSVKIRELYKPHPDSSGEDNGQVTIIGGSKLFHGASLLSLKVASRIVDMVFFSSPEPSVGVVADRIKSELLSFIWVPWDEVEAYVKKSDAVLIGPGLMRFLSERRTKNKEQSDDLDEEGEKTRKITERLLKKYPNKKWVIDAGSLQVMEQDWIPKGTVLTPNAKEFQLLFEDELDKKYGNIEVAEGIKNTEELISNLKHLTSKYDCTIVLKGPETFVCSPDDCVVVKGGNAGLTKGGTGDVLAGLTTALFAKNEPFLAAASASYIAKRAADDLFEKVGTNYNADDLATQIPVTFKNLTGQ